MEKYTFKQVAKWFINKATDDTKNGGVYLTKSKLQRLMYYAKGFYYVFMDEDFFECSIIASKNGPTVKELSPFLKKYESNDSIVNEFEDEKIINNAIAVKVLEFVYEKINKIEIEKLNTYAKEEDPWKNSVPSSKISEDSISNYFRNTYLADELKNNFEITDKDMLLTINYIVLKKYDKAFRVLAK